jgi:hypothetical protein
MIRKLTSGEYRLYSRKIDPRTGKRRNLGTFKSRAAAEKGQGTPGPMAIFTGSSGNDEFLRSVSAMLRPGRRLRTFSTIHDARRWLDAPLGRAS